MIISKPGQPEPQPTSAPIIDDKGREEQARSYMIIAYILLAFGVFAFLPWIAAAILIYVKREDMIGTIYESHASWCLRTFWFSMLWDGLAILIVMMTFGIGLIVAWPAFVAVHIWVLYRIIKGAVRVSERRPIAP